MMKDEMKNRLQYALKINDKKAADLVRDLGIPKSAVSQYLSGKSRQMSSDRLFDIAKYLHVSEAWLMGYDAPMERRTAQEILGQIAKEKVEDDMMLEYFHLLNEKGKELALIYVKSLSDMKDFRKE